MKSYILLCRRIVYFLGLEALEDFALEEDF
jgi:hypothetical protein